MSEAKQDLRIGVTAGKPRPILTIATPTVNDFDSCSQTLVTMVNQLGKYKDLVEFLLVDNAPLTGDGHDNRILAVNKMHRCNYVSLGPRQATFAGKEVCIQAANTEWVLVCDSHIVFDAEALPRLLRLIQALGPSNDLFQGPIVTERWEIFGTHMNPAIGGLNFGRWGAYRNPDGTVIDDCECYQVPMQGMGVFLCRRDAWPGFSPALFQFGSEEGYIHEKYRLLGRNCWSIPFLKWWHRFRDKSVRHQYDLSNEHKYRNYLIAWSEVGLPLNLVETAFEILTPETRLAIQENVQSLNIKPMAKPAGYVPFLGYPMRLLNDTQPYLENYREYEVPIFAN